MNHYREKHGDIGTPCFWSRPMINNLKCLSSRLLVEMLATCPENHRLIADTRALVTFFDAIMKGTDDGNDLYD